MYLRQQLRLLAAEGPGVDTWLHVLEVHAPCSRRRVQRAWVVPAVHRLTVVGFGLRQPVQVSSTSGASRRGAYSSLDLFVIGQLAP